LKLSAADDIQISILILKSLKIDLLLGELLKWNEGIKCPLFFISDKYHDIHNLGLGKHDYRHILMVRLGV
jgi:hypothetical protein